MNRLLRAWRRWLCRCRFKDVCSNFCIDSPTCQDGGGNYCGDFRSFKWNFEAELLKAFGPAIDVDSWGKCVIILGPCFTHGWRRILREREYRVYSDVLDGRLAVFVPLKQSGGA